MRPVPGIKIDVDVVVGHRRADRRRAGNGVVRRVPLVGIAVNGRSRLLHLQCDFTAKRFHAGLEIGLAHAHVISATRRCGVGYVGIESPASLVHVQNRPILVVQIHRQVRGGVRHLEDDALALRDVCLEKLFVHDRIPHVRFGREPSRNEIRRISVPLV